MKRLTQLRTAVREARKQREEGHAYAWGGGSLLVIVLVVVLLLILL